MTAPLFVVSDDPDADAALTVAHQAYRQVALAYQAAVAAYDVAARAYYRKTGVNTAEVAAFNAADRRMRAAYEARDTAYRTWRAAFNALTDKGDTL